MCVLASGLCRLAVFQKWELHFMLVDGSMELTDRSIDKDTCVWGSVRRQDNGAGT